MEHSVGVSSEVSLVDAWSNPGARDFFLNVWPMYVHEIAGFDTDFYRLDASGRWQPDIVGDWIASSTPVQNLREDCAPTEHGQPYQRAHVIVHGGRPVGFACVGFRPFRYMSPEADAILSEFFLVRGSRGYGIGPPAFSALIARYPGRWTMRAIHDNARAIGFWRKTLPESGLQLLRERTVERDVVWDFTAAPQNAADRAP